MKPSHPHGHFGGSNLCKIRGIIIPLSRSIRNLFAPIFSARVTPLLSQNMDPLRIFGGFCFRVRGRQAAHNCVRLGRVSRIGA